MNNAIALPLHLKAICPHHGVLVQWTYIVMQGLTCCNGHGCLYIYPLHMVNTTLLRASLSQLSYVNCYYFINLLRYKSDRLPLIVICVW